MYMHAIKRPLIIVPKIVQQITTLSSYIIIFIPFDKRFKSSYQILEFSGMFKVLHTILESLMDLGIGG